MNKKFILSLLLPAALVACNNDEIANDFAVETPAGEIVENLMLNVSFDTDVNSRGTYAGSEKSLYSNFYLEPAWNTKKLSLSDNFELKGNKLGFCLTNGANAITNLPFYIAGYGSTLAETEGAQLSVYTFCPQDNTNADYNKLYDLKLDATQKEAMSLHGDAGKDAFDKAVSALGELEGNEALAAGELDLRKAILRTNAGVMTGEYVAYYPHNDEFVDPAGIPAVELDDLYEINEEMPANESAALTAIDFNNKVFAVSQSKIAVDGGNKSSSLTLSPLTSLFVVELYNSNKTAETEKTYVKRVTVESEQGFILDGSVALNNLGAIVAKEEGTTDLVGIAFEDTEIAVNKEKGKGQFVAIPFYPNAAVSDLVVTFYKSNGTAASVTIDDVKTTNGKVLKISRDYAELEFEEVTRKVFTPGDLEDEVKTAGTLKLMTDITVSNLTIAKDIVIEGNGKTLTLTNGTISNKLVCNEGVTLALNGTTVSNDLDVDKLNLTYATANKIVKHIKANELTVKEGSTVTLTDAEVGTLTIEKTAKLTSTAAADKVVKAATINNSGTLELSEGTEDAVNVMTATTALNNKAGGVLTVNAFAEMSAVSVTNDAAITTGTNKAVAAEITVTGELDSETITNNGELTWMSEEAIDMTLNNAGTLKINETCALTGELNNTGTLTVAKDEVVTAATGTLNVNAGNVTVNGTLNFSNTGKMEINAGVVNSVGTVNGANYITVAEGAEFIRTVNDYNNFVSALGTANIAAKFTGVRVAKAIEATAAVTATKKIYLAANLTLDKASTLANVEVEGSDVTLTAKEASTIASITIIKNAQLTVGANSVLEVTGTITNNGTYVHGTNVVVNCSDASGDGIWTNNPNY